MTLTPTQAIVSIAVMAIVTFLTRFLPFLLFDRGEAPPKIVLYLGRVLPPAVIAMLIIYCLRSPAVNLLPGWLEEMSGWWTGVLAFLYQWAPQIISGLVTVILHIWKRNNLLSIFSGTILYMILVQAVFV